MGYENAFENAFFPIFAKAIFGIPIFWYRISLFSHLRFSQRHFRSPTSLDFGWKSAGGDRSDFFARRGMEACLPRRHGVNLHRNQAVSSYHHNHLPRMASGERNEHRLAVAAYTSRKEKIRTLAQCPLVLELFNDKDRDLEALPRRVFHRRVDGHASASRPT